jgi:uncharacterized protein (DUF1778 family)
MSKSMKVEIRVTPPEKTAMERAAKRQGMTVSEWLRSLARMAA